MRTDMQPQVAEGCMLVGGIFLKPCTMCYKLSVTNTRWAHVFLVLPYLCRVCIGRRGLDPSWLKIDACKP